MFILNSLLLTSLSELAVSCFGGLFNICSTSVTRGCSFLLVLVNTIVWRWIGVWPQEQLQEPFNSVLFLHLVFSLNRYEKKLILHAVLFPLQKHRQNRPCRPNSFSWNEHGWLTTSTTRSPTGPVPSNWSTRTSCPSAALCSHHWVPQLSTLPQTTTSPFSDA